WPRRLLVGFVSLGLILGAIAWYLHEPRPSGQSGPEADALARRMMAAVDCAAWDSLPAVAWTFAGQHDHLWDKERHLARVQWGTNEVLLDINAKTGIARVEGQEVTGEQKASLIDQAWKFWVNDAFWLNPVCKAFDPGTSRSLVPQPEGDAALMVSYSSGGATPGDAYLWHLGPDDRPEAWQMWVSVIPTGGMRSSWDNWQQLPGGAWVATSHEMGVTLALTDVRGGTLAELSPEGDPFATL
ncbi:MAG: hypothetical protein D6722_00325, partial [Bacteroidetes bacterium]